MDYFLRILKDWVERLPSTAQLRTFGLTQVPLLFLVLPKVVKIDPTQAHVLVKLNWLTKNHLKSMYFGSLAIGADCVVGILALHQARFHKGYKIVPIFKDFSANFLKRAESDVLFLCEAGEKIQAMVEEAKVSGERVTASIPARAVNAESPDEVYAEFTLGLSLKVTATQR